MHNRSPLFARRGRLTFTLGQHRQRFGAMLRLEVGETVLEPDDVEDEMRELIRAVSA